MSLSTSLLGTLAAAVMAHSSGALGVAQAVQPAAVPPAEMSFEQLQACIAASKADCDYEMGRRYFMGQGLPVNYETSFQWYQKAAQEGQPTAMAMLASAYEGGVGTAKDDALAFSWYGKGAAAGNVMAMDAMGRYYERGGPVTASKPDAVKWYSQAANKGSADAMANLARIYEADGNMPAALDWGKKAAQANNVWAAYTVGEIYYNGRGGVKADPAAALPWYQMAAYWNLPQAQYQLARMYYNADGVKNDDIEAYVWMSIAAERGEVNAQDDFTTLQPQITADQRQQVETRKAERMQEIKTRSNAAGIFVYPLGTTDDQVKPATP